MGSVAGLLGLLHIGVVGTRQSDATLKAAMRPTHCVISAVIPSERRAIVLNPSCAGSRSQCKWRWSILSERGQGCFAVNEREAGLPGYWQKHVSTFCSGSASLPDGRVGNISGDCHANRVSLDQNPLGNSLAHFFRRQTALDIDRDRILRETR